MRGIPVHAVNWIIDQDEASVYRAAISVYTRTLTTAHIPHSCWSSRCRNNRSRLYTALHWERERAREREVGEIYLLGGTRYINVSASSTISDTTGTTNYECFIAAFFRDRANFTDFKVDRAVKKGDRPIHLPNKRQLAWFYFMTGPHFCMKSLFFPSCHALGSSPFAMSI